MPHARYQHSAGWVVPALWAAGAVGLGVAARSRGWAAGEIVLAGGLWLVVLVVTARDFLSQLFGPVFAYEMLRLGRRKNTFLLRGLYVLAACGLLALMYMSWLEEINYFGPGSNRSIPPLKLANFSARFFYAFQALQYGAVAFLTPALVAGAITDEKERKTLEFMLATDLTAREIVFGKLAARVATLLMFVAAGLPVLAFLQLFGGIDPELLLAGTAASVVTVVGLSAWSTCLSVLVKRSRDAVALTYLTFVMYLVVATTVAVLVQSFYLTAVVSVFGTTVYLSEVADWLAAGNVGHVIYSLSGRTGSGWVNDALGRYAAWWAVVTVLLIAVAVVFLRPAALRQAGGGATRTQTARRRRPVGSDPMFWKEVVVDGGNRGGFVGKLTSVLVFGIVLGGPVLIWIAQYGDLYPWLRDTLELQTYGTPMEKRWKDFVAAINVWVRVVSAALGARAMLGAAVRGAGGVTGEREKDTWVSLMGTRLSAWEMLAGKWWGCVLGPRQVYWLLAAVWGVGVLTGAMNVLFLPLLAVVLGVYVSAFAWLGLFFSITCRTTLIATARTIPAGVFVGGGFWFAFGLCCVMPMAVSGMGRGMDEGLLENVAQLMLGATPPFTLGWLPMYTFESNELGPFMWQRYRSGPIFGPLAPVIGTAVWAAFAAWLSWECHLRFRAKTNRVSRWERPRPPGNS